MVQLYSSTYFNLQVQFIYETNWSNRLGQRITPTESVQGGKTPQTSIMDMTGAPGIAEYFFIAIAPGPLQVHFNFFH